jgi:hypothetical protein
MVSDGRTIFHQKFMSPCKENVYKRAWKRLWVSWAKRDVRKIQRTHDVGIKVIGNGHVNQLVQV